MTSQPNENLDGKHLKIPTQETSQALDNEGTPKCLFCPLSMSFKISHDCYILRFNPITQMIPIYMSPKSRKQSFFLGARNHFDILKLSFYHQCFILSSSCLGWKCTFCVYLQKAQVCGNGNCFVCAFTVQRGHCCLGNLSLCGTKPVYFVGRCQSPQCMQKVVCLFFLS